MCIDFEELDYRRTALGDLSLRRRTELALGVEVLEVKLGDEILMSSLFTEGEIALVELALADRGPGPLDVVVGDLGLGYTARAVRGKCCQIPQFSAKPGCDQHGVRCAE